MKTGVPRMRLVFAALGLAVMILDGKTALQGAASAIEICLYTVLPTLFPFIFLSSFLTEALLSLNFKGSHSICKMFNIPQGSEAILLTGLIGGYPVGARCIGEAVSNGHLSSTDGDRMVIFCNAAGPSFLFGIISNLFEHHWVPWILWGIHLLSCLSISRMASTQPVSHFTSQSRIHQSTTEKLRKSVQIMGEICGWIILMRTFIAVINKWCLWILPKSIQILITGILELSNGCLSLAGINNHGMRFVLCSVFLSFGGLCIALQTQSAAPSIHLVHYISGKFLQAIISFLLSYVIQHFIFPNDHTVYFPWLCLSLTAVFTIIFVYRKRKSKIRVEIY